jgi:hypothetical protein
MSPQSPQKRLLSDKPLPLLKYFFPLMGRLFTPSSRNIQFYPPPPGPSHKGSVELTTSSWQQELSCLVQEEDLLLGFWRQEVYTYHHSMTLHCWYHN